MQIRDSRKRHANTAPSDTQRDLSEETTSTSKSSILQSRLARSLYGSLRSSAVSPPLGRPSSPSKFSDVPSRSSCPIVTVEQETPPSSIPTDALDDFVYVTKDDLSTDDAIHPTSHKFITPLLPRRQFSLSKPSLPSLRWNRKLAQHPPDSLNCYKPPPFNPLHLSSFSLSGPSTSLSDTLSIFSDPDPFRSNFTVRAAPSESSVPTTKKESPALFVHPLPTDPHLDTKSPRNFGQPLRRLGSLTKAAARRVSSRSLKPEPIISASAAKASPPKLSLESIPELTIEFPSSGLFTTQLPERPAASHISASIVNSPSVGKGYSLRPRPNIKYEFVDPLELTASPSPFVFSTPLGASARTSFISPSPSWLSRNVQGLEAEYQFPTFRQAEISELSSLSDFGPSDSTIINDFSPPFSDADSPLPALLLPPLPPPPPAARPIPPELFVTPSTPKSSTPPDSDADTSSPAPKDIHPPASPAPSSAATISHKSSFESSHYSTSLHRTDSTSSHPTVFEEVNTSPPSQKESISNAEPSESAYTPHSYAQHSLSSSASFRIELFSTPDFKRTPSIRGYVSVSTFFPTKVRESKPPSPARTDAHLIFIPQPRSATKRELVPLTEEFWTFLFNESGISVSEIEAMNHWGKNEDTVDYGGEVNYEGHKWFQDAPPRPAPSAPPTAPERYIPLPSVIDQNQSFEFALQAAPNVVYARFKQYGQLGVLAWCSEFNELIDGLKELGFAGNMFVSTRNQALKTCEDLLKLKLDVKMQIIVMYLSSQVARLRRFLDVDKTWDDYPEPTFPLDHRAYTA